MLSAISPLAMLATLPLFGAPSGVPAVGERPAADLAERVVGRLTELLSERYAYKGCERWIAESLDRNLRAGRYAELDPAALGQALTGDLRGWTADKHFMVAHLPDFAAELEAASRDTAPPSGEDNPDEVAANYGIRRAEMVDERVGLIELDQIAYSQGTVPAFQRALASLPQASALILDLRANHGGSADTVPKLLSCFFPKGEPVRLGTKYWRPTDSTTPIETDPDLEGVRYYGHPVFLLTSADTRSAAEALAYHLRSFGRAFVVGERSSGGAHPADMVALSDGFVALVPMGLVTNARTGTDWEGRGVPVDEPCPADRAEAVALDLARHLPR